MSSLPAKNSRVLVCLAGVVVFSASFALAAQEAVYKDSRPMKKLFESQKKEPGTGEASKDSAQETRHTVYDPTGKTDPFKSFLAEQEAVEEKKDARRRPRTYLETLDLSQLDLIAIIVGPKGNWAMVRDSKGVGHVIQKGTLIGTNSGLVHGITEKEVIIREETKDFRGNIQHKDIAKRLPSLQPQE